MQPRGLIEAHAFRADVANLIPDAKESDAILQAAKDYLCLWADLEEQVEGTQMYFKIVPHLRMGRFLVIYFTIGKERVELQALTSFPAPTGWTHDQ